MMAGKTTAVNSYAGRIDQQLEEQALFVHHQKTWFHFDPGENVAYFTSLYLWYGSDFEQVAGSVPGLCLPVRISEEATTLNKRRKANASRALDRSGMFVA